MDIELKSCPFCGGRVVMEKTVRRSEMYGYREWFGIICRNTNNRGGSCAVQIAPSASAESAAARWNMRDGKP